MRRTTILVTLLLMFSLGLSLLAQEVTGTIQGTVTDKSGAVVRDATITVTNIDRNAVIRTTKSDSTGGYVAPLLPVGRYSVAVAAAGFKTYEKKDIELNVSDRLTVNAMLVPGAVSEVMTVQANADQVETQSATSAGLINGTQIRELSLTARNYTQLVTLQPGVSSAASDLIYPGVEQPGGGTNEADFSINGQRFSEINWTLDGADNVDRGGNFTLLNTPSVDAITEFKVLRSLYSPEYGRGAGGEINVITRSGTNQFHGGIYEFVRNNVLNANRYENKHFADPTSVVSRQPLRYNDFGWTFGGPIYIPGHYNKEKNKTFFFYSEEIRRVVTSTSNIVTVPNGNERNGIFDFSPAGPNPNGLCTAYDTSGNCTAIAPDQATFNAALPGGQFNPAAAAYIKDIFSKIPLPQDPVGDLLTESGPNIFNFRQELIRVDHTFNSKLTVSARWLNDSIPTINPAGLFAFTSVYGYATTQTDSPGHNLWLHATMTFKPTLLNEAGYAWSYGAITSNTIGSSTVANSPNVAAAITLPFANPLQRIPNLAFSSLSGLAGFGPYGDFNRNHQWFDNLTWVKGRHTMKFGFSYARYQKNENDAGGNPSTGSFSFQNVDPGGNPTPQQEWASFLLGNVSSFAQAKQDFHARIRQHSFEAYAQDEYRVRPNLTLTYGLRYTYYGQPFDADNRATNFDPTKYVAANAPVLNPADGSIMIGTGMNLNGVIIAAVPAGSGAAVASPFGSAVANQDHLDFAPRVGVAWDPFNKGKTSLRGGWGLFYDSPAIGFLENNTFANPPFVGIVNIPNAPFQNPAGGAASVDTSPVFFKAIDTHWHLPYTQMWSFDVQQELPRQIIVDVGYYGSIGRHLLGIEDINQPGAGAYVGVGTPALMPGDINSSSSTNVQKLSLVRPFQGWGAINTSRTIFGSDYQSLQASVQKHWRGGSLVAINYTYSHANTNAPNDFYTPQNNANLAAEEGPTDFDRRHIFTANFVYDFPWMKSQHGVTGHLLGGWEMSGIITYNSGLFLTANCVTVDAAGLGLLDPNANTSFGGGASNQGLCPGRPDQLADPNQNAAHTFENYVPNVFADPPATGVRPGNEPRGSIHGPGIARWDLSLFKNIRLTERTGVQLRFEGFNVFNQTNFDSINLDATSTAFGQVGSTREPRIIQLGMKFSF